MARMRKITPDQATSSAGETLRELNGKLGAVPNVLASLANSPAALDSYIKQYSALSQGVLTPKQREVIGLLCAKHYNCNYSAAVHTACAKNLGMSETAIAAVLEGKVNDAKLQALITFTSEVLVAGGNIDDKVYQQFLSSGYDEEYVGEIVANIALSVFATFFNHINKTEMDYPRAPVASRKKAMLYGPTNRSTHSVEA